MSSAETPVSLDFIRTRIARDVEAGKNEARVHTRFPPEPNGYLHIGHAKAILLSYGVAVEHGGLFNLRFDDTNPSREEAAYVDSMKEDIAWLGADWGDRLYFASDYFDQLHDFALKLINDGKAYVCDLTPDEVREYRGTLTEPGKNSPYRDRSVEENLELFAQMKSGAFLDGSHTLRAKIDMASGNLNMRDPVMYRVQIATHHRTGDAWAIYPMYDWAHGQSDSIEGITHSLCDLSFEDHRPLYDWFIDQLGIHHPQQIEFARLNLGYTVLSKRRLIQLVQDNLVSGWDDPRMPTLCGLRRRGYTPESIRTFCERIGVAKRESIVDMALLEHGVREDLNSRALRVMAVLNPVKLIIDNYPVDQVEQLDAINNPEDESAGGRTIPFSRELYIEREDFQEEPHKKFFRLAPGREVRLKHAYYVTCDHVVKDETTGEITELHCTYDPESRGGGTPDGRRVKGTLHWVSAAHAVDAEVRLFDTLFSKENPLEDEDFKSNVNPDSMTILTGCMVEPGLVTAAATDRYQFLRQGYFCLDSRDSRPDALVFNRTVGLRDSWAKMQKK